MRRTVIILLSLSLVACGRGSDGISSGSSSSTEAITTSAGATSSSFTSSSSEKSSFSASSMRDASSSIASLRSAASSSTLSRALSDMMIEDYAWEGSLKADKGNAYGTVKTTFDEKTFSLLATVIGLPDPPQGKQYIGWIVRASPPTLRKTGAFKKVYGSSVHTFTTSEDLRDFTYFGVTLDAPDATSPGQRVMWAKIDEPAR